MVITSYLFLVNSSSKNSHSTESKSSSSEVDIPKFYITGNLSEMYNKEERRIVQFTYKDTPINISGYAQINIQGNSSSGHEKKNYTIRFYQDPDCTQKQKLDFGWGKQNQYCLKANWIDYTHSRNIVTAQIAAEVQRKYNVLDTTPNNGLIDGFPIEIYNNDEFLGLYTLNVPKDQWLFGMDKDDPNHIAVCGNDWEDTVLFHEIPNFTSWELEVGNDNPKTLASLQRLFEFVMYSSNEEFKSNIHQFIDLDAVLNYYLISDFAFLADNWGKNMLLITYDSRIWYPCLYDLDTSWGTNYTGKELYDYEKIHLCLWINQLFMRIEHCFGDELSKRYFELRKDIFTQENVLNKFSQFKSLIPDRTFIEEKVRWGNNIPGFSYNQIKHYLEVRIPILDKKYSDWDCWLSTQGDRFVAYFDSYNIDIIQILRDHGVSNPTNHLQGIDTYFGDLILKF